MSWWHTFGIKDETRARKVISIVGIIMMAAMISFALLKSDWDMNQLAISMRVWFVRIFYVVLLWTPGFLCDLSTEGDSLETINSNPMAMANFYGYMGIATAIVLAYGPS